MKNILKPILALLLIAASLPSFSQLIVKPNSNRISYMGRINVNGDSALFYWPGSSATIRFKGTGAKISMRSLREPAYFYAIVDGDTANAFKFKSDSVKKSFSVASNLRYGKHSMQIFKLTNNTSENIFYGYELEGKAKMKKPAKRPKRKIEFYGNSITAGHGVDVPTGMNDSGSPEYFDNFYTYAAETARHFNAQYSCIARSGIGIMISWFPEIMPEIYDRLDPMDPASKWNFSKYTPDVVVINLFQNDYWLTNSPNFPEFKRRFGTTKPTEEFIINSYKNFVSLIRARYPQAQIICALGNMDATVATSKWPGYIEQAIARLHDNKIHSIFFPYKNTPGHPKRNEQRAMANQLINFIDNNIKW